MQEKLKIKVDDKYVLDQATYDAFAEEMGKMTPSGGKQSFVVYGTVYKASGQTVKRQKLIALDVDLRGAAIFRTARTIEEIEKNGGFEFLQESESDGKGNYSAEFFEWQFSKSERKKADVVIYAINANGKITGRSRIVNSEDYSETGEVKELDIIIADEEEKTEYDKLMHELIPYLDENGLKLPDIAGSSDQIKFISTELDEFEERIQLVVDAESLQKKSFT